MHLCKTFFSLKYGTYSTEELVQAGVDAGANSLALTNINCTCDAWDFVQLCQQQQIKPILGVEIRNGRQHLYTLLAANNSGFRRINEFLSEHMLGKKDFPEYPEVLSDVFVIYPLGRKDPADLRKNELIGVLPEEANKLLRMPVMEYTGKWIVRQPVTFQNKVYYNLHRLLRAVDLNTLLTKLQPEDLAGPREYFLPQMEVLTAFRNYPFIVTNTYRLFEDCTITMDFGADKNKKVYSASREDDRILLEKLAREGCRMRYGFNKCARERLNKELRI
ncbi:MAG TPA: PHP domain-containing protein, partial [Puia sp.]